ncbi:MAG: tetratricopeptide repeat protein [Bryobacteraceae bacterium]|jgi:tetratricopeptide (TPR) repeat protein
MKLLVFLLLAASPLHFDITDARGKHPSGVTIDAAEPDADGWYQLHVTTRSSAKSTPPLVLIWPYDGRAKTPDGPEPIPAIVIQAGDPKALENHHVIAAMAAGVLLNSTAPQPQGIDKAIAGLANSEDAFAKGVGLLYAKNSVDAIDPLARALRERERQLTRVPSEIYPAAMLYGRALFEAGKFEDAAVAYMKAMKQRPSDAAARNARAEALIKAGKPEAAESLLGR